MTQWIRWWGLGVFAAIILVLWLVTNPLIEWSIEFAGTQAVGAKVELDSVDLGLNPVTLKLNRLQVTNPNEPMRNITEAGRIEMALDGYALMRRQFIAETMAVEGLRFGTERSESGAIEGRLFSRKEEAGQDGDEGFDIGSVLPGMEMPDPDRIVDEERERLAGKVDELDAEAREIEQGWNDHIESLPSGDSVDNYRERWDELKEKNPLSRVAGVRELKKDIDGDLERVSSLDDRLKSDRQRLSELAEQARNLPAREAERLMAASGLDEGFQGVTRQLMGEQLSRWVDNGLTGYRLASRHMAGRETEEETGPPRGEGEDIRFPEEEPLPGFLVKRAAVDGVARMGASNVDFDGSIRDITREPAIWGKPMTLELDGTDEAGATLEVDGTFDHREEPGRDQLDFKVRQLTLKDATFSGSSKLPIVLEEGKANIDGNLSVTGGDLDATVNTEVSQASFAAGAEESGEVVQRLARAIEGVSSFRMDLGVGGTLGSPEISLNSNLDQIIGKALGDEVRGELAEARQALENRLRAELGPELESLAGRQEALDEYREQIDQRRKALKDIRP
ncbi:uncharacterized protein (TIGR03545 family) [Halospina denitrificans]|uniref:Uncharacterized protein (TIGR03545 family) n=1 Tax=Halospina denitrificans TaxID=332522 RepID=A0A4R7JWR8_9GAMM|nr:TIGR03545 family protein [Halospina denitrificans]TDT41479.1 uncharacterized protein (TIGR03545 family) [Halospina denitrificans]